MALAVCSVTVLMPSTARADSIRAQTGPSVSVQQSDTVDWGDDDATFQNRSGFERSLQFANVGFADVFADDRTSFCNDREFRAFGLALRQHLTVALRQGGGPGHDKKIKIKIRKEKDKGRDDTGGSPNPEPASVLLIATGAAGLFLYRRHLLA